MKKLLFGIFVLLSSSIYAQVDYESKIKGAYVEFYDWNYNNDEYIMSFGDWLEIDIDPYEEYYLIEIGNDGDVDKVWWEYGGSEKDFSGDSYYTKDGRKLIFHYDSQEIWFFHSYNENNNRYEELMVVSKIEAFEKE